MDLLPLVMLLIRWLFKKVVTLLYKPLVSHRLIRVSVLQFLVSQKGGKKKGKKGTRKLKGGAFPSISEFASAASFRPLAATAPPGDIYKTMMDFKGTQPYPTSLANTDVPPYQVQKPMVITSTTGNITRDLRTEI